MIGKASSKDETEITKHIKQKSKTSKQEIHDTVQSLDISAPYSVQHKVRGRFDADNLRFSGIPAEWKDVAHKQFGIPLIQCPRIEVDGYPDRIPLVLVKLRLRLEELGGLETEGIFRLAPSGTESTDVKTGLNSGLALSSLQTTDDPHVASNLIKQFFRELPPNLLNPFTRDTIMEITEMKDESKIDEAFHKLPEPNFSSFLWLLDLMLDVAAHSSVNKMTEMNLAIVISPNLYFAGDSVAPMEVTAIKNNIPIVSVYIVGGGYDYDKGKEFLATLTPESLDKVNNGASKLLQDIGIDVIDMGKTILSVFPNIIAQDFNANESSTILDAQVKVIVDKFINSM